MRIKRLFSVPDGEKITEKALRRVLISTVCSILLCMGCLVSTTWAWFQVSIENDGNVIQIASPKVEVTILEGQTALTPENGKYTLQPEKQYSLQLTLIGETGRGSDLPPTQQLYAIMTVVQGSESQSYYVILNGSFSREGFTVSAVAEVTFEIAWITGNAQPLLQEVQQLGITVPSEPSSTILTQPSSAPSTEPSSTLSPEPSATPSTESSAEPSSEPGETGGTDSGGEPAAPAV